MRWRMVGQWLLAGSLCVMLGSGPANLSFGASLHHAKTAGPKAPKRSSKHAGLTRKGAGGHGKGRAIPQKNSPAKPKPAAFLGVSH